MRKMKLAAVLVGAAMLFAACEPISQELPEESLLQDSTSETEASTEEIVYYTEYVAEVPEITNSDASMMLEAEECDLSGELHVESDRKGYSGEGYVTGFEGGISDYMVFNMQAPSTQHYDITVCVAADEEVTNSIIVNNRDLGEFVISGDGNFVRVTFYGVFMEEGLSIIKVNHGSGNFDIDYIEITNNEAVYEDDFEVPVEPVAPDASTEAKSLLRYLQESFGEKIITGQYASSPENKELELIYKTTGKYPAIRFSDIGEYSKADVPSQSEIDAAKEWDAKGGIVGFMWYWKSPDEAASVYTEETEFSLEDAVTDEEIWNKSLTELTEMSISGEISEECLTIVKDIDKVSEGLNQLAEECIPVLWRPLHEAGGGWYWWGADGAEAYKWLYNLMYQRMTEYHELDNLIWIWNGQSEEYLVDSDKYDIAALDIYLGENVEYGSRSEQFYWLKEITGGQKLLAVGECSTVPGIDEMCRDNSIWSFFGLWFGEYIMNSYGEFHEKYTPKEELIKIYNAENSVTLDSYAGSYGPGSGAEEE